jgi:hypothetical protein
LPSTPTTVVIVATHISTQAFLQATFPAIQSKEKIVQWSNPWKLVVPLTQKGELPMLLLLLP